MINQLDIEHVHAHRILGNKKAMLRLFIKSEGAALVAQSYKDELSVVEGKIALLDDIRAAVSEKRHKGFTKSHASNKL